MANNQIVGYDNVTGGNISANWAAWPGYSLMVGVAGTPNVMQAPTTAGAGGYWTAGPFRNNDFVLEVTAQNIAATGGASLFMLVRWSNVSNSVTAYQIIINPTSTAGSQVAVYKIVSNVTTLVANAPGSFTYAAGDVWAVAISGCVLSVYQNGKRLFYIYDLSIANGTTCGIWLAPNTTNVNTVQVSSVRLYNYAQQDGVWTKTGTVFVGNSTEMSNTPNGIAGTNVKFWASKFLNIGSNCYGMYYGSGNTVNYAESLDANTWTRYGSNPLISPGSDASVFLYAGTYYIVSQATQGSGAVTVYTSSDGLTFTLLGTCTGLPGTGYPGGIQAVIGGNFYLPWGTLSGVGGAPSMYMYTAPTGTPLTWTAANSGVAVITGAFPGACIPVGSNYYMWATQNQPGQNNATVPNFDPYEAYRYKSPDLIAWTADSKSIHASNFLESLNNTNAGTAPNSLIDVGGKVHFFYQGSPGDSTGPQDYQCMVAIAPVPLATLVTQQETGWSPVAADAFARGAGALGANWSSQGAVAQPVIASSGTVQPSALSTNNSAVYTGAGASVFGQTQYSSATIKTLAGTTGTTYLALTVFGQLAAATYYGLAMDAATGVSIGPADFYFFKAVSGVWTTFGKPGGSNLTLSAGDVVTLSAFVTSYGSVILTAFQNGFQMSQFEDYAPIATSGYPGFYLYNSSLVTNTQISSWGGGNSRVLPFPASGGGDLGPGYDFKFRL